MADYRIKIKFENPYPEEGEELRLETAEGVIRDMKNKEEAEAEFIDMVEWQVGKSIAIHTCDCEEV